MNDRRARTLRTRRACYYTFKEVVTHIECANPCLPADRFYPGFTVDHINTPFKQRQYPVDGQDIFFRIRKSPYPPFLAIGYEKPWNHTQLPHKHLLLLCLHPGSDRYGLISHSGKTANFTPTMPDFSRNKFLTATACLVCSTSAHFPTSSST